MNPKVEKELLHAKLPLWLEFPDIPRYSIDWRMGVGDDYSWEFSKFWKKLSAAAQQEYQKRYPEPVGWRGFYSEEDWDEEERNGNNIPAGYELDKF